MNKKYIINEVIFVAKTTALVGVFYFSALYPILTSGTVNTEEKRNELDCKYENREDYFDCFLS